MKLNDSLCSDEQLFALLRADEGSEEALQVANHVQSCKGCQQRLEQLAASRADWNEASEVLTELVMADSAKRNGNRWSTSNFPDHPIAWNDAMAMSLLSPPSHPEMLGRIGRYEVERLIGSGGMGVVFKAHDTELNRPVAVKLLAPYLASSGSARNRFAREARAAAGVVDDHVVPIHNVETDDEHPFLVMKYIAGGSLQQRIDREGPLDVCEVLRIGMQTAKGLAAAHSQGLIHRDVKPSNILLDEGVDRALLTDFGLARANDDASLTRSGFHPGTPHYMSPEQVRGEAIDARSDLFGLGCVLYALCTGHPPFRAETSYAVLCRITDDSPRPIREINTHVPEWLEQIVMKLLAKSRDDRFDSAEVVAELLEDCLAHVQHPASTPLPSAVAELDSYSKSPVAENRGGFGRSVPPAVKWLAAAGFAFLLIFASVLIVLEMNKGTLTIKCAADDVPVRISRGERIVRELTVSREGASVRIAAGNYRVEVGGDISDLSVIDGVVFLNRGETEVVRITLVEDVDLKKGGIGDEVALKDFAPFDCYVVDAATGLLIRNKLTITLRYREPSTEKPGQVVADIFWGPDAKGEFNLWIPDAVLKHPNRDRLIVEWGVAHADYEAVSGELKVRDILPDAPKSVRETVRLIRLKSIEAEDHESLNRLGELDGKKVKPEIDKRVESYDRAFRLQTALGGEKFTSTLEEIRQACRNALDRNPAQAELNVMLSHYADYALNLEQNQNKRGLRPRTAQQWLDAINGDKENLQEIIINLINEDFEANTEVGSGDGVALQSRLDATSGFPNTTVLQEMHDLLAEKARLTTKLRYEAQFLEDGKKFTDKRSEQFTDAVKETERIESRFEAIADRLKTIHESELGDLEKVADHAGLECSEEPLYGQPSYGVIVYCETQVPIKNDELLLFHAGGIYRSKGVLQPLRTNGAGFYLRPKTAIPAGSSIALACVQDAEEELQNVANGNMPDSDRARNPSRAYRANVFDRRSGKPIKSAEKVGTPASWELGGMEDAFGELVVGKGGSRRSVACLVLAVGGQRYAITARTATVSSDINSAPVDGAILKVLPGEQSVEAQYDQRSSRRIVAYELPSSVFAERLDRVASVQLGEKLYAYSLDNTGSFQMLETTVGVVDPREMIALSIRNDTINYRGLFKVDAVLTEGTPLFQDGKFVGLTMIGRRFGKVDSQCSWVIPAKQVTDFIEDLKQEAPTHSFPSKSEGKVIGLDEDLHDSKANPTTQNSSWLGDGTAIKDLRLEAASLMKSMNARRNLIATD